MDQALPVVKKHEVFGYQTGQFPFQGLQELPHHRCRDPLLLHLQNKSLGFVVGLDHGNDRLAQILAALVDAHLGQLSQSGFIGVFGKNRRREQLPGGAFV